MSDGEALNPREFKRAVRAEWKAAAPGWDRWCEMMEAEEGGQVASKKLVELAGLMPGQSVLDVAAGYGELASCVATSPSRRPQSTR